MKRLLTFIILLTAYFSFAQLPIKLTYFTCKSVDWDKVVVSFHTASEINVSTYEVHDGDQIIQSIIPRNTIDNTYEFNYKPIATHGVLKLVSTDEDGTVSLFFSKYTLPKETDRYYRYSYDGKYLGISFIEDIQNGFIYMNSEGLAIKK